MMQQAISCSTTGWTGKNPPSSGGGDAVVRSVAESAVIVIGRPGCCMCHVVRRLLLGLGVNPPIIEISEEEEGGIMNELIRREIMGVKDGDEINSNNNNNINESKVNFYSPIVFVGGKLFGGLERVMASHISGELVPILRDAGALWL